MPLYEYKCSACGERFEVIQRFADAPVETCRKCGGGPVERMLSAPAIQFKGTGWYITDYARKGTGGSATVSSNGSNGNGSKSSESTASASKTETSAKAGEKEA